MNTRRRSAALAFSMTVLFWLLLDAGDMRRAVAEGISLCLESVIPALFPFLAVSSLVMELGLGEWAERRLGWFMALWGLPGAAASALLMGLVGGYPLGARTAADLKRQGLLTREEAERLLTFCNNANPAFFLSVLGAGVFTSTRTGLWLWLIHLAAALVTGLLLARPRGRTAPPSPFRHSSHCRAVRLSSALVTAVRSAASAMMGICAFVVFFFGLTLPLRQLPGLAGTVLVGLAELFSLLPRLTADRTGFLLAAALSGWGGASVLCQTVAALGDSGLSAAPCVRGKAVQGLVSLLLAALLVPWVFP